MGAAMSSRLASLEQELATKEERIADLEAEARTTQQEPAVFQCGFQDEFATGNAVIRFDRLTLDEQTGAGGLDTLEISKPSTLSTYLQVWTSPRESSLLTTRACG